MQQEAAPAQDAPRIRHITGWRRVLALPLALLVRGWNRSLRFEVDPESHAIYSNRSQPLAFTLWHNRLFIASEIPRRYRQGRPIYALVSASRDGAWLEAFFTLIGVPCVRGSSSKMGREAASALVDTLRAGFDIGITPDGPRGPRYEPKPGAFIVTRRARAPLLLIGAEFPCCLHLHSWDRFALPLPFSKVKLRAILLRPEDLPSDRDQAAAFVKEQLLSINPD